MNSVRSAYLHPAMDYNLGAVRWALFLAAFTAGAVALPYACHHFGIAGMVFLPMHFAVLIAAIVMGLRGGVAVALISPALSYAMSSMPPTQALLPITIELATYVVVVNIAVRKLRMPLILSLVVAMLSGRIVSIALVSLILQGTPLATQLRNMFIMGLPGIAIQLIFVPLLSSKVMDFLRNE